MKALLVVVMRAAPLAVGAAVLATPTAASAQSSCRSTSPYAENVRRHFVKLGARSDTASQRLRAVYSLPAFTAAEIVFVTADSICQQASAMLTSELGDSTETPGAVWVLKVANDRFLIFDGLHKMGDRDGILVVDSAFTYLITIVM